MDAPDQTLTTIKYLNVAGYQTHHADGVLAGATAQGDVFCMFFVERPGLPTLEEHAFNSGSSASTITNFETEGPFIREIQTGIKMSRSTATLFRDRLNDLLADKIEKP